MPKRTDIKSICIIGAGPIVIGQACEFDYSGTQACKALREEGYRIVLVNSNPATIMTDPETADVTYVEPITPKVVAKILEKERPDALLPTMGGQTALNCALALDEDGTLERLGIEMIGAKADVIDKAENRERFKQCMDELGLDSPRSKVVQTLADAKDYLDEIGLPAIIRPSFTMGGTGGGVAYNKEQFEQIVREGLDASPTTEVLIDESLLGWKEYEMEVVRDKNDNCIIICSIENLDPMGVHTGDSITVAPALTLTDKEYQIMRTASLNVLRAIGVETGGSNVQFGLNPENGRMVVIEMNPRVSRSSALASKATGFPIAKIAAKLAVGYTLDELGNDITGGKTPASFEPTIDYVVTKVPRFAFEKFKGAEPTLTTAMKSVGESMAIGRSFEESLQKSLRSLEAGLDGLDPMQDLSVDELRGEISRATPQRILYIAEGLYQGMSVDEVYDLCKFDKWFLRRIQDLMQTEKNFRENGLPTDAAGWLDLKKKGFSDAQLAKIMKVDEQSVRQARHSHNVRPVYKRVDSCAAEIPSETNYMYGCYESAFPYQSKESQTFIRQLTENDWATYKDMRLTALKTHPDLYFTPYEDWADRADQDWKDCLNRSDSAYFGLFDKDKLIGIGLVAIEAPEEKRASLHQAYISPDYRGRGLSALLYRARLNWAKENPNIDFVEVGHEESNEPSRRANQAFGFQVIRTVEEANSRGETRKTSYYELDLKNYTPLTLSLSPEGRGDYVSEIEHTDKEKVIILGGGPNRIGQGIEFDYCCVHAAYALKEAGYETIMVNCNPETVSTDYDTSDRLYFEPLTEEDVVELIQAEMQHGPVKGVIVQLGGQTPLKLANALQEAGIPILGTDPDAIDLAEDRDRFQKLVDDLGLMQPPNGIATSEDEAMEIAEGIGFPLVIRPSYVLGGQSMRIVHNLTELQDYIESAVQVSGDSPVLLDRYLKSAIEIDVDALCDGDEVYVSGIMEHIEEAGVHSGDSACVLPPHSLPMECVKELEKQTIELAKALKVKGLMNIQFAAKMNPETGKHDIYLIEVNPRASRTVPFVAKATGTPIAKIAARIMAGEKLADFKHLLATIRPDHSAVKAPVFPFDRFPGVEPLLGPEMKSTGEVMGIDKDLAHAMAKAQLAAGNILPKEGKVFLSVKKGDKEALVPLARDLQEMGFELVATGGTCAHLLEQGLKVERIKKVMEGQPNVVDAMINGEIKLVINTTAKSAQAVADSTSIRRQALMNKIPYYTVLTGAKAAIQAIRAIKAKEISPASLQSYFDEKKKKAA